MPPFFRVLFWLYAVALLLAAAAFFHPAHGEPKDQSRIFEFSIPADMTPRLECVTLGRIYHCELTWTETKK